MNIETVTKTVKAFSVQPNSLDPFKDQKETTYLIFSEIPITSFGY